MMETGTIIAFAIGIPVVLFPAAFIWYVSIGGILTAIKSRGVAKQIKKYPSNLTCSVDTDCPQGYVCIGGRCVLEAT